MSLSHVPMDSFPTKLFPLSWLAFSFAFAHTLLLLLFAFQAYQFLLILINLKDFIILGLGAFEEQLLEIFLLLTEIAELLLSRSDKDLLEHKKIGIVFLDRLLLEVILLSVFLLKLDLFIDMHRMLPYLLLTELSLRFNPQDI